MDAHRSVEQRLAIPAIASAGAAVLHAAAAGIHADSTALARVFIVLAVAQAAAAMTGFVRSDRTAALVLIGVNGAAAVGWAATRLTGISWITGLEAAERPGVADSIAAVLALVAVVGAASALTARGRTDAPRAIAAAAVLIGLVTIPGLVDATSHNHGDHDAAGAGEAHDHDASTLDGDGIASGSDLVAALSPAIADHPHGAHDDDQQDDPGVASPADAVDHSDHTDAEHAEFLATSGTWPSPWNPDQPIDFSGVDGVSDGQRERAERLVDDTLRTLPQFADVATLDVLGYRSIGDAATGFEHFINAGFIGDDRFLDPAAPESLVFRVDGDDRTLVSAMFIANGRAIDDPELTDFAGPLMQWHVHDNLCWGLDDQGVPVVKGVLENPGDTCPPGTVNAGGENPMVHVWIAPHECGPFAALDGHGAGQAGVDDDARTDVCSHEGHGDHGEHGDAAASKTTPFDPDLPIDLGGVSGVTPQQQAFAENLVAATVRDLPQWADLTAVEAAGFRSIGDAGTGHEHYIQWDWIDDDRVLDPDYPESLVFEPRSDGSKELVAAMFMLPGGTPLDEVPDLGGELMQWHVHGDLCFTDDPVAPQVAGVKPLGGLCQPPLVDGTMSPMIHVWIRPHECGPFAALDGIGGGQVPDGEVARCDTAHGSH
jgi:hypothetical protein